MPSGTDPDHCTSEELILRVPRFEAADVQAESLLLIHLYKTIAVPTPSKLFVMTQVLKFELLHKEVWLILMQRLKGESLLTAHSSFTGQDDRATHREDPQSPSPGRHWAS